MFGSVLRLLPESCIILSDSLLRALTCFCCWIDVSQRYSLYESHIQHKQDFIKSGVIPASSSRPAAQTLPEWEEKHLILLSDRSRWTAFAQDCRTSEILPAVKYLVRPYLFTNMPMGSEYDWPSLLVWRKILCAAWTGQMLGWSSSATKVIVWLSCLIFLIRKVILIFFGNYCSSLFRAWMQRRAPLLF